MTEGRLIGLDSAGKFVTGGRLVGLDTAGKFVTGLGIDQQKSLHVGTMFGIL